MFEFEQDIVKQLLSNDDGFRRLYQKHQMLKEQVQEAHVGVLPLDDVALENLKKEKLLLKDKMAVLIADYRRQHA